MKTVIVITAKTRSDRDFEMSLCYTGFYTKLNVWGSLGLNFEYDGGPIIEIGGPIFLDKLRILEGSTSFHEGSVLSPGQLFWGLHVCLAPFRYFVGPFEFFEGHILPSLKHNPIRIFLQKLNLSL